MKRGSFLIDHRNLANFPGGHAGASLKPPE